MSTRRTTDYLKGLIISLVVVDHYVGNFAREYYPLISGYAYALLGLFFVLAGYGCRLSLEKRLAGSESVKDVVLGFMRDRALKIIPIYAVALIVAGLVEPGDHGSFWEPLTPLFLIGFPLIRSPGIFWFVPAIIQCYLLAPVMYFLVRRLLMTRLLLLAFFGMLVAEAISRKFLPDMLHEPVAISEHFFTAFIYYQLFFTNLILFFLGMLIPDAVNRYGRIFTNNAAFLGSFLLFVAALYLSRLHNLLFEMPNTLFAPVFIVSFSFFCAFIIAKKPPLPLDWVFAFLGKRSYPIYLFHFSLMGLAAQVGSAMDWPF